MFTIHRLLLINVLLIMRIQADHICPIGYQVHHSVLEDTVCHWFKGPERFQDKFVNCTGNLYSKEVLFNSPLLDNYSHRTIWADYKTIYAGGQFTYWPYTKNILYLEPDSSNINNEDFLDKEICSSFHRYSLTATKCDEWHYRLCVVKPYHAIEDMSAKGCEDLQGYFRMWGPRPTCLRIMNDLKVNWTRAMELCVDSGGELLAEGWRYANHPILTATPGPRAMIPLDIARIENRMNESTNCEDFYERYVTNDMPYHVGVLRKDCFALVDKSYEFSTVICERPIILDTVTMDVAVDSKGRLTLSMSARIDESHISCFTDHSIDNFTVSIIYDEDSNVFLLEPVGDGYYWCTHTDSENYQVAESNKALFIKDESSLVDFYAIKLKFEINFRDDKGKYATYNDMVYIEQLKSYVLDISQRTAQKSSVTHWNDEVLMTEEFTTTELMLVEVNMTEGILEEITESYPVMTRNYEDMKINIKRYVKGKLALLHLRLGPGMEPVFPGPWTDIEVLSMKPVYYCKGFDSIPMLPLGAATTSKDDCQIYSCVGDFNEGVQWKSTVDTSCMKLKQVVDDLNTLLTNDSVPITVEAVSDSLDRVDALLETQEDIQIPGGLLQKIDDLAARIDLKGSQDTVVRSNIALVMADARPDAPVRGLRIAARDDNAFTVDGFEIITSEVSSSGLTTAETAAVVHLPESVSSSSRRVSFVVFRNERAFPPSSGLDIVNSLVLSINVENFTQLEPKEVIDIHLRPIVGRPDRNMTQACAYWNLDDNGTGSWSQEGCTLIQFYNKDVLDICRCSHLTHFAEVLVPRSLFNRQNENILEILTITGCCLSVFGLSVVGLTAVIFSSWREEYSNRVWLQLCLAILILIICFLTVIFAKFDSYDIACLLFGVALHYATLASFCWMLVAAVLSYKKLVTIFKSDVFPKMSKLSVFSWGAPCVVLGILLLADPYSYATHFGSKSPSGAFCYPSGLGLWLAVYTPIAIILIANWTMFAFIIRSLYISSTSAIQKHGDSKEALRSIVVSSLLVFLFGLPWIFGLFASNIVAAYFFTISAAFQGFILFIFFVVLNNKTRGLWLNILRIKKPPRVTTISPEKRRTRTEEGVKRESEDIHFRGKSHRSFGESDNSVNDSYRKTFHKDTMTSLKEDDEIILRTGASSTEGLNETDKQRSFLSPAIIEVQQSLLDKGLTPETVNRKKLFYWIKESIL